MHASGIYVLKVKHFPFSAKIPKILVIKAIPVPLPEFVFERIGLVYLVDDTGNIYSECLL